MKNLLSSKAYFTPQRDFFCFSDRLFTVPPKDFHCHDFYELEIVLSGNAVDEINGTLYNLHKGDFIFLQPDDFHGIQSFESNGAEYLNIAVSITLMKEVLTFLGVTEENILPWPIAGHLSLDILVQLLTYIHELTDHSRSTTKIRSTIKQWIIVCFLNCDFFHDPLDQEPLPFWLQEIITKMKTPEGLSGGIEYLKQHADRSYPHVCKSFHRYFNKTPGEWINEQRLIRCANLLRHTDLSILEISLECGFHSLSHFNHVFKEYYGISPTALRSLL